MMTLPQAERLVRKITELLGQPGLESQAAKLAQDYSELARAASHRLEQCSVMIDAGEDLQALQLAETPPPLLDLITILSFRQAGEWREHCQKHGLPTAEPFYDKFVRQLNTTYGKGIASDHPYYRDYRRAIMTNDEPRALSILRVIARLNPTDKNTAKELERLEDKALRAQLEALRGVVDAGQPQAVIEQLAELEASPLPIPPTNAVWQRAQVIRCERLLEQAEALRQREAWEATELVVEEIRALANHYGVALPDADTERWNSLEEWTTGKRSAFAQEQDFQRALAAFEYQVQTSEAKRAGTARQNLAELQTDSNALVAKWREAERFGRTLDSELLARSQQSSDWLQRHIRGRINRKRAGTVVGTFAVIAALAVAGLLFWDYTQAKQLAAQLGRLEPARRVGDTERLLAQVPERLKSKPQLAEALAKARQFVSRERGLKAGFDQRLTKLQGFAAHGFTNNDSEVQGERGQAGALAEQLAPEFASAGKTDLEAFDAQWKSHLAALEPAREAEFSGRLAAAEKLAADRLNGGNGVAAVRAALPGLQSLAADLQRLQEQPVPLQADLARRFQDLTNLVARWTHAVEQWDGLQANQPHSLAEHLERLTTLGRSPFATAVEQGFAADCETLKFSPTTLIGGLLLPGQMAVWDRLTNLPATPSFRPVEPTEQEKVAYRKLNNDPNAQEIYEYKLITNAVRDNPYLTHIVFTRNKLGTNKSFEAVGAIYDWTNHPAALQFAQQKIDKYYFASEEFEGLTPESQAFQTLGLRDLIDPNNGNYQRSILDLLDAVNQDTSSSPLFRAYLEVKLYELAGFRQADWGLPWSPTAAANLRSLTDLGAQKLQSGDWMVPNQNAAYRDKLRDYFTRARQVSLAQEAQFYYRLAQQTTEAGFDFEGYADGQGNAVLTTTNDTQGEYWGWSRRSRSPALLFRRGEAGAPKKVEEPLAFTPLFAFRGDRRTILDQTAKLTSYPIGAPGAIVPPLFAGIH